MTRVIYEESKNQSHNQKHLEIVIHPLAAEEGASGFQTPFHVPPFCHLLSSEVGASQQATERRCHGGGYRMAGGV